MGWVGDKLALGLVKQKFRGTFVAKGCFSRGGNGMDAGYQFEIRIIN